MARIFYVLWSTGGITGGQKMIIRHVETLRELGFDAYVYATSGVPEQLDHRAPVVRGAGVRAGDVVVAPDDGEEILQQCAAKAWRPVVIAQNPYLMSRYGLNAIEAVAGAHPLTFIAVSEGLGRTLKRMFPAADVEVVRCFADERRFRSPTAKRRAIAYTPKKRLLEAGAIEGFFKRLHPQHANFAWNRIEKLSERETAEAFAASAVFLSLNRLESVGMTTLEAMASGCICAGFLGVGGREYATPDNGFWVPDDDCEAAADALAEACAVALQGGPERQRRLEAGYETARQWTYAGFRRQLEETWMRIAPDTRLQTTPLDV
jgi:hypothetical protein